MLQTVRTAVGIIRYVIGTETTDDGQKRLLAGSWHRDSVLF